MFRFTSIDGNHEGIYSDCFLSRLSAEFYQKPCYRLRARLIDTEGPVNAIIFSRDGRLLISGGTIVIWIMLRRR
jgi:hypothetical protein